MALLFCWTVFHLCGQKKSEKIHQIRSNKNALYIHQAIQKIKHAPSVIFQVRLRFWKIDGISMNVNFSRTFTYANNTKTQQKQWMDPSKDWGQAGLTQ